MDSQKSQSLNTQTSLYNLTLDEVQTHLGSSGKPLGSMNLDELLKSVCSVEANQPASMAAATAQVGLSRQGSLSLPKDVSKKTVDEVWKDIQQNKNEKRDKEPTFGQMTLEDLLLKAGMVTPDSNTDVPGGGTEQNITQVVPWVQGYMPQPQAYMPYSVSDMQMVSQSSLLGGLSDTQTHGRKRAASGEVVGKVVERKQKRMIKNRESAARSRARKQAYTHELEIKVSRLEEENERLKREKEVEMILPIAPPPDPKRQLRRTSSSPF